MSALDRKKLTQIKKDLKEESTDDILNVLSAVQAIEQAIQQELKRRS